MREIVLVDIGNFLDTRIIDKALVENNFSIMRPYDSIVLETIIDKRKENLIFLVLYYNFLQLKWLMPLLSMAQKKGHIVTNIPSNIKLMLDYPKRAKILEKNGFIVPRYFFGKANEIPKNFSQKVVYKSQRENLTILCDKNAIHSLNDNIYIETQILNRSKTIVTVYDIFGYVYVRLKEDALQTKTKLRQLVNKDDYQYEIEVAKKIQAMFGLAFYNIEFVNGYIIDVNTIANFYYTDHKEPLEAMIEYMKNV